MALCDPADCRHRRPPALRPRAPRALYFIVQRDGALNGGRSQPGVQRKQRTSCAPQSLKVQANTSKRRFRPRKHPSSTQPRSTHLTRCVAAAPEPVGHHRPPLLCLRKTETHTAADNKKPARGGFLCAFTTSAVRPEPAAWRWRSNYLAASLAASTAAPAACLAASAAASAACLAASAAASAAWPAA